MRGKSKNSTSALTLLEVMVALSLVVVAIMAIVAVYTGGLKLSARGEHLVRATEVAQSTLETIRELGYDKIPEERSTFSGKTGTDPTADGFPPPPYPGESDYPIEVVAGLQEPDLKFVTVRVFYDQRNSVVLQTYFTPFE